MSGSANFDDMSAGIMEDLIDESVNDEADLL